MAGDSFVPAKIKEVRVFQQATKELVEAWR